MTEGIDILFIIAKWVYRLGILPQGVCGIQMELPSSFNSGVLNCFFLLATKGRRQFKDSCLGAK